MSMYTINEMIEWIEDNLCDEPTLLKMSETVGYSSYYCSNKFHEMLGISFKSYVSKRRLSMASKALQHSNQRILDIAISYGYSSHEAFTRAFMKEYGYTPKQYRNSRPSIAVYPKAKLEC